MTRPLLQRFDERADGAAGPARLTRLRARMQAAGVQGFLIPRTDPHMGEDVSPHDARLAWATGFTGSAGICIALEARAAVIVDGRYTLQAAQQVDADAYEVVFSGRIAPSEWLGSAVSAGMVVAYDPWLHPRAEIDRFRAAVEAKGASLRPTANLVDEAWEDQPPPPGAPVVPHPEDLAGESGASKRARLAAALAADGIAAAALTLPASIAWLTNTRGDDVPRMPAPHAFALLRADGALTLYSDPAKYGAETRAHMGDGVSVEPWSAFEPALQALAGETVAVDASTAPAAVSDILEAAGAAVDPRRDPCILPKACKTAAELAGARAAHRRDGAAMAEFLCWLDARLAALPDAALTEIDVVTALENFRADTGALRDISFETICGAGPDGAVIHYRVTEKTNRAVARDTLLLIDSGAQYQDGTTDITRTVFTGGVAPDGAAAAYTAVLRGMISLAAARWPEGKAGRDLDPFARAALWAAGLDYAHGTGHGVGAYLGVHEGPASISSRGTEPLRPGMILSDEPGCYREGAWGIRIENLVVVTPPETPAGGTEPMLRFETLTLAPIDRALILPEALGAEARAWLDAYHARVFAEISPLVGATTRDWLSRACAPL